MIFILVKGQYTVLTINASIEVYIKVQYVFLSLTNKPTKEKVDKMSNEWIKCICLRCSRWCYTFNSRALARLVDFSPLFVHPQSIHLSINLFVNRLSSRLTMNIVIQLTNEEESGRGIWGKKRTGGRLKDAAV